MARLDTFESTASWRSTSCSPPSDWLRDLKAASHDPDALAELLRRATAARAWEAARAEDVAGLWRPWTTATTARPAPMAVVRLQPARVHALRGADVARVQHHWGRLPRLGGKATGEGFQTPSAPAQPSPALFCGDGVDPWAALALTVGSGSRAT